MSDMQMPPSLNRRLFLAGGAGLFSATLLPGRALAKVAARAKAGPQFPATAALVDDVVSKKLVPGAMYAIGRGFAAPEIYARGTLAFASDVPVDGNSLWRLFSMTKPITGIAAMILIDEGKLKLDQPIADFIPAYAKMTVQITPDGPLDARPAKTLITVRHLLTHTAGLGYTIRQNGPIKQAYLEAGLLPARASRFNPPGQPVYPTAPSLAVFAERLAKLPLVYEPGTRWSYSVGLDLLGRVIELASGKPFDAFLAERIFHPLAMHSTGFIVPAKDQARLTTLYSPYGSAQMPIDPGKGSVFIDPPAFPFGGAGLVGSANDYDRFLMMLLGEGAIGKTRIMSRKAAVLAQSNLLPMGADTKGTWVSGQGFGAGGRVTLPGSATGEGIFGWAGAAGTIGIVDRKRQLRCAGYVQSVPSDVVQFDSRFRDTILADLSPRKSA